MKSCRFSAIRLLLFLMSAFVVSKRMAARMLFRSISFPILLAVPILFRNFAPSLSQLIRGRRAVLYMRKTFSNVCRCDSWISQVPIITTGRWQRDVCVVRFYIHYYIVRAGVGWWALSILCDGGNARAYDSRMGRRTDTYAFFVS